VPVLLQAAMESMPADIPAMARVAQGTSAATATALAVAPSRTQLAVATAHLPARQPKPTAISNTKPQALATVIVSVVALAVARVARRAKPVSVAPANLA
jgi:hypothetical protein